VASCAADAYVQDWEEDVWVCGEARAVLRADFLFNGCQLEVSTDESVRHIPRCVTIMRRAFD
jgi:hypothetical protein